MNLIYYELGKVRESGIEHRNKHFQSDRSLVDGLLNLRDSTWKERLPLRPDGNIRPQIHFGPIASGDKVIASDTAACQLFAIHPKLIAVEMESAGVASAAFSAMKRIGFLTIRGICDFADASKNDNWHEYAAHSAASCLRASIENRPVAPSEGSWPKQETDFINKPELISVEVRQHLFNTLKSAVDMEEFKNLCFLIGVDIDELPGDRKSARIRELILLFERRREIHVLKSAVQDILPKAAG